MKSSIFFIILLAIIFNGNLISQNVPTTMNYHGKLSNSGGQPLNEEVSIVFNLYTFENGGISLWTESHENLLVSNGIFDVLLGSLDSFPADVFNNPQLYLGITVNGDGEMSPRSVLSSVPYAIKSGSGESDGVWQTSGENIYRESGKVGIGVAEPVSELQVAGTVKATNEEPFSAGVIANGTGFGVMAQSGHTGVFTTGGMYGIWSIADVNSNPNASAGYFMGKVGIGTIADCQLDVADGQISVSGKGAPNSGSSLELSYDYGNGRGEVFAFDRTNNLYKDLRLDGSHVRINATANTGNVSIGTGDNDGRLHVYNGSFSGPVLFLEGGAPDEGDIAWKDNEHLQMGRWNKTDDTFQKVVEITNTHAIHLFNQDGDNRVKIQSSESGADGAQISLYDDEGNAVIVLDAQHGGQPGDPARIITETLEITGGSDLAEPFEISGTSVEKGFLVCIDPENPGMVKLSEKSYDKCVAGIASGANNINPGLILKQEGTIADGEVPVALSGRVYCKADASFGKIKPGDLLTTSITPGHAMKAKNHRKAQGAIIGKAMTGLDSGTGWVLVLVAMQ